MACRSMSPRVVTVSRTVSPCRRLPTRRVFSQLPPKVVSYTQVFDCQAAHGAADRSVTCTPPKEAHSRPPLPRLLGQRGAQESVGHGQEASAVAKEEAIDGRESRASRAPRDSGRRSGLESLERLDRKPKEGSSSTIDPASGMLQPVLDALEGLKKDFEGRFEKVDQLTFRIEAMASKLEAHSSAPSEEEVWEARCEQLQEIADRAVNTAVQSQISQRIEKIDAQLGMLLAMGEKQEASSAAPSEKEIWEEPGQQLQDIADRAVKTAVQSQLSQRIENIDAKLAQLLERLKGDEPTVHEPSSVSVQTESESEDKSLRETVEKQEFQLQVAAGENLWLKDENAACRDILRHALAEKNTYQGHLAATQRHLGFLGSTLHSTMPEDGADEQQDPEKPRRATAPGCCWYAEVHLGSAGEGTLAGQDMVAAYKASHRGKRPKPEHLVNWVKNHHDKVITYRQACCLIAASTR